MKVWVTDKGLGEAPILDELKRSHEIICARDLIDLRDPGHVERHVQGADAILHTARCWPDDASDETILDHASRGTFVVAQAAVAAGIDRLCLISDLSCFGLYPDGCVIDESWRPIPGTSAGELAPLMAERVCREFSRQHSIRSVCLRFGELGQETSIALASAAILKGLTAEIETDRYRWQLYHVSNTTRFPLRAAKGEPLGLEGLVT